MSDAFLKQLRGFRAFSVVLSCFAHSCDDVAKVLRREACAFLLQYTAKFQDLQEDRSNGGSNVAASLVPHE